MLESFQRLSTIGGVFILKHVYVFFSRAHYRSKCNCKKQLREILCAFLAEFLPNDRHHNQDEPIMLSF